jgi:hypothetical protein
VLKQFDSPSFHWVCSKNIHFGVDLTCNFSEYYFIIDKKVQLLTNKSNEIHQISNDKIANPHQFGNETYNEIELGSSALRNTLPSNFVNSLLKNK